MQKIFKCLAFAAIRTVEQDGVEHSGYMSFMVLLSIFPFLVFILAFTSFFGASELGANLINIILENMPERAIDAIKIRVSELAIAPPERLLTLAIFGSVWTASSFVECLRTILNRVYDIKSPPTYIYRRILSIIQFIVISAMITLTMLILVIVPIILRKIPALMQLIENYELLINLVRYSLIPFFLFLGVSLLYYILPNVKLRYIQVVPGSVLTIMLWIISGYLLSEYIVYYNQLSVVYGSLGSIIVTLIFFYIINLIFIYGAEFNYLLHRPAP